MTAYCQQRRSVSYLHPVVPTKQQLRIQSGHHRWQHQAAHENKQRKAQCYVLKFKRFLKELQFLERKITPRDLKGTIQSL
jgi:hypothetical protein